MSILLVIFVLVRGQIDVHLQLDENYDVIVDDAVQRPFDPSLKISGQSCAPCELFSLTPDGEKAGEERLILVNKGSAPVTVLDFQMKSTLTDQIKVAHFPNDDIIIPAGQTSVINMYQICPDTLNADNYWTVISVEMNISNTIYKFDYQYVCDLTFRVASFDWSVLLLVVVSVCVTAFVAYFAKIYSFKYYDGERHIFQGFKVGYKITFGYVALYAFFAMITLIFKYADSVRYFEILLIILLGFCCCFFMTNEILSTAPRGSYLKLKIFKIRVHDCISLVVSLAVTSLYWIYEPWYLGNLISVAMIGSIVKIFKFGSLLSAIIFMVPAMVADIVVAVIIHYTQQQSYNTLTLQYLNSPLEISIPVFVEQFNRRCAWISLFSVAIPGLLIGFAYRFDKNKNTLAYCITTFTAFLFAEMLWILSTVVLNHSWPSTSFTYPLMILACILVSIKRAEFKQILDGNFYDPYLDRNYKLQSISSINNDQLVSMHLFDGLDKSLINEETDKPRRPSTDITNKQKQGVPPKAPQQQQQQQQQHTAKCDFCDLVDPAFRDTDKLDQHLWGQCPMLINCQQCQQVIEIAELTHHLLAECDHRRKFKQCPKCKEAHLTQAYDKHVEECRGRNDPQTIRCPLCHTDLKANANTWKMHLVNQGCLNNERTAG